MKCLVDMERHYRRWKQKQKLNSIGLKELCNLCIHHSLCLKVLSNCLINIDTFFMIDVFGLWGYVSFFVILYSIELFWKRLMHIMWISMTYNLCIRIGVSLKYFHYFYSLLLEKNFSIHFSSISNDQFSSLPLWSFIFLLETLQ